jgi:hypothetical protein
MKCYYHPEVEAVATCVNCGKAICQTCSVDVAGRLICQNCLASGSATRFQAQAVQPAKPTNPLAIASLILGVLGLCGGLPFSIAAWITGYMALKQLSENQNQEGLQLANAGKWLGIVITILYGVVLLCYVGMLLISLLQQQSYR